MHLIPFSQRRLSRGLEKSLRILRPNIYFSQTVFQSLVILRSQLFKGFLRFFLVAVSHRVLSIIFCLSLSPSLSFHVFRWSFYIYILIRFDFSIPHTSSLLSNYSLSTFQNTPPLFTPFAVFLTLSYPSTLSIFLFSISFLSFPVVPLLFNHLSPLLLFHVLCSLLLPFPHSSLAFLSTSSPLLIHSHFYLFSLSFPGFFHRSFLCIFPLFSTLHPILFFSLPSRLSLRVLFSSRSASPSAVHGLLPPQGNYLPPGDLTTGWMKGLLSPIIVWG